MISSVRDNIFSNCCQNFWRIWYQRFHRHPCSSIRSNGKYEKEL